MPEEENPVGDFVDDLLDGLDAGVSRSDLPTEISDVAPVATGSRSALGMLPGHEVRDLVARGGMGAVYRATQSALEREVAVKVMTRDVGSPEMAARFRREAIVLGKLEHPNIVPVHDVGVDEDGQLFYTMKLVKGRTLQAVINDLRREDPEALKEHSLTSLLTVFRKVCDAMAFAHSRGVLHRDLKPENIMVGEFGEVLVMDWGLAKTIRRSDFQTIRGGDGGGSDQLSVVSDQSGPAEAESLNTDYRSLNTVQGSVLGTPQYMSPEQARGEIDELDERSDIFSLGGVLYAILTLRPPVEGKTLQEVLEKVRSGEITSPTELVGKSTTAGKREKKGPVLEASQIKPLPHTPAGRVPPSLSAVAMKALSLEKGDRYRDVAALGAEVEKFQAGFATMAEQAGLATQLLLLIRRHRGIFTTVTAACLLIATLGVWFVIHLRVKEQRAVAGERSAVAAEAAARSAEAVAVEEKERASQALAKSQMELAEKEYERGQFVEARRLLEAIPEESRDANHRFLTEHFHDFSVRIAQAGTGSAHRVEFLPEMAGVAARCYFRNISMFSLEGERIGRWVPVKTPEDGKHGYAFGIDARGTRMAFPASANEVGLLDLSSGEILRTWTAELDRLLHMRLSPDGGTVLATDEGQVIAYDSDSGRMLWRKAFVSSLPAFSPDGRTVAILAAKKGLIMTLHLLDSGSGELRRVITMTVDNPKKSALQFDQDGLRLACIGGDEMVLWDLKADARLRALHFPGETVGEMSPSGKVVATFADNRIRLWETSSGNLLRTLNGAPVKVLNLAFSADGRMLVSSHAIPDGSALMHVWPTRVEEEIARVRPTTFGSRVRCGGFASDGTGFFTGSLEGVTLWGTASGLQKWTVFEEIGRVHDLAAHPTDGSVLVAEFADPQCSRISPTGEMLGGFSSSDKARVQFSRDGSLVLELKAGGGGLGFSVMRYPSGEVVSEVVFDRKVQYPFSAFCLGETAVATAASSGGLKIWDWKNGVPLREIGAEHTGSLSAMAASPDGKRLATCGPDRWIRIWEAATGRLETAFRAHWEGVRCIAFSPDGEEVLSGSERGVVRIHEAATGRERLAFYGLTDAVDQVEFSPDGALVSAIAVGGSVNVWDRRRSAAAARLPRVEPTDDAER